MMLLEFIGFFLGAILIVYVTLLILQTSAFWAIAGVAGFIYMIGWTAESVNTEEYEAALVFGSLALLSLCITLKAAQQPKGS